MNFQQLRSVRETVRCRFNLTEVALALHTSQSGVSRQIRELEDELGVGLFVRSGKRLMGLTEPGEHMLPIIDDILQGGSSLRNAGQDFLTQQGGQLAIAATHSQARYALPTAVQKFRLQFPEVQLHLHQGSPKQVAQMLLSGEVDIGVATEALADYPELVALPCDHWTHSVIVPQGHSLLDAPLSLTALAAHPLITYGAGFTGRSHIDEAFAAQQLSPNIVLSAMDADVIKTYVQLGMGVGIVASIAFQTERDSSLRAINAGELFGINLTRLAVRRGAYLRGYVYAFISSFAPKLSRETVSHLLGEESSGGIYLLERARRKGIPNDGVVRDQPSPMPKLFA